MLLSLSNLLFILFISFVCYNLISITDYFKQVNEYNDDKCYHIKGPIGIEDMIQYKHYLIGGSNEYLILFTQDTQIKQINNGQMVILNLITNHLVNLPILNYPQNIPFHPHGISLYQNKFIYVINHSMTQGERVEVLQIQDQDDTSNNTITLFYDHSIVLPLGFNQITNDLAVIETDEFYISTSYIFERNSNISIIKRSLIEMLNLITVMFKINLTYTYHYKNNTMTKIPYSNGLFNNGIAYDNINHKLYIAQTLNKKIRVLDIEIENNSKAKFNRDINLDYAIDNIHLDLDKGIITTGTIGQIYKSILYSRQYAKHGIVTINNMYGGGLEINLNKKDEVTSLVINKDKMKTVTSAIHYNSNVYLSSFGDEGILICSIPN